MKVAGLKARTKRLRETIQVGLATALTLGAISAGYVAGKASAHSALAEPMELPADHAAEARMEGLLLLLLGRGGVL